MVARLRTHCATCGRAFPAPRTSVYCDRLCQERRVARPEPSHLLRRELWLAVAIECAAPWERPLIEAERRAIAIRREAAGAS